MAFAYNPIAAFDSAGDPIPGGLLAGDLDAGNGPQFLFHGLVDGVAGINAAGVDSSNRLAVLADLGATDNAVLDAMAALLGTIDADTSNLATYNSRLLSSAAGIDPAAASATTSFVFGSQYDSAQKTLTDGQQAAFAMGARGEMIVVPGAQGFVITDIEDGNSVSVMDQTASAVKVLQVDTTGADATIDVGSAGAASTDVVTVQGIASMTPLLVNGSGVTQPVSGTVAVTHAALTNIGAMEYETVAASQTNQVIGATGAAGDYLSHVIISPAVVACGAVTIYDNATALVTFAGGGTTALSNLWPVTVPVGVISTSGAFKITTGANVSCTAVGNFT